MAGLIHRSVGKICSLGGDVWEAGRSADDDATAGAGSVKRAGIDAIISLSNRSARRPWRTSRP